VYAAARCHGRHKARSAVFASKVPAIHALLGAAFLASDAAKSISGQLVPFDNDRQKA
jgi:hypothetical protein